MSGMFGGGLRVDEVDERSLGGGRGEESPVKGSR